jgi:hypothetical protein
MADFVAVLRKTLDGLGETTPEVRARVYDKARSTIAAKLAAINPPPAAAIAERQKRALEEAISQVEAGYAKPTPSADPLAELENIFSSIDRNKNQPNHVRPGMSSQAGAKPEPAAARSQPAAPQPVRPEPKPAAAEPARKTVASPVPYGADGRGVDKRGPEAVQPPPTVVEEDFSEDDGPTVDMLPGDDTGERRRRGYGGLIAAVIALAVIGGGGYGVWLNQDAFKDMLGLNKTETAKVEPAKKTTPAKPTETAKAAPPKPEPAKPAKPADNAASPPPAQAETQKFTQRLMPDGKEVDPGPAAGESHIGEGTSVVALTTPPPAAAPAAPAAEAPPAAATPSPGDQATTAPAAADAATNPPAAPTPPATAPDGTATPAAPASTATSTDQPALAVGQKAIFYEERTSNAEGSAESGSIVWSPVQESPGGDAPPEPAIRAEASIPGKDVQLRMTIRRNTDKTLPASHIIEMIFLTPDGFEGGGIDNVLRIAMKGTEQEAGSPLIGIPAKIADGFFLVALNDTKADEDANLTLLRNQDWIDIPVVYKSGRRALLTMEKGIPGDKVFDEAMKAWQAKTSG